MIGLKQFKSMRRLLTEAEAKMGPDAYEQEFANYPPSLHRYLPGAMKMARKEDGMNMLEKEDRRAFKHEVAWRAHAMRKLSNQDLGDLPDLDSLRRSAEGRDEQNDPYAVKEEASADWGFHSDERPDDKIRANPVRVFKTIDEGFLVRLGPRTRGGLSKGGLIAALYSEGIPMEDVQEIVEKAEREGQVTYTVTFYHPSEVE